MIDNTDNSIYLGDIDPNNEIQSTIDVRRNILFQLLIWDSIVLSDSQLLTDPRINVMMKGFRDDSVIKKYKKDGLTDIPDWQKGFEALVNANLVEVAHRETDGNSPSFLELWGKMSEKDTKDVPYLPESNEYSLYLDGIGHKKRYYNLPSMGKRFKDNLNIGVEDHAIPLSPANDTDMELKRMFREDNVLFRNILDFLQAEKNHERIDQHRYDELYNYVYSCYSINVSAETNCNINTKFKNIPFHLSSGEGDFEEAVSLSKVGVLRPTWALNPYVLDFLSFERFVKLRRRIKGVVESGIIKEMCSGTIAYSRVKELEEKWEAFTIALEEEVYDGMLDASHILGKECDKVFPNGAKHGFTPRQQVLLEPGIEVVKNVISAAFPVVDSVGTVIDICTSVQNMACYLSRREDMITLLEQKERVEKFLDGETKVVTRYFL